MRGVSDGDSRYGCKDVFSLNEGWGCILDSRLVFSLNEVDEVESSIRLSIAITALIPPVYQLEPGAITLLSNRVT